ncbi:Nitrate/nitrite transporter [Hahella chejuensis KCTC 2396]|uniref:Nitrate/nitrite transporter n=1 Tax=Hahella chejuensis (strain KCTC 2396) TaxID=349521 RepID=Q2SF58_HAHCH|nr:MFS transporter [Hahella chejuensis]ABC30716.1 Nitrate/nitrite transporter [Hahella chejuensis KCTC 2396]
MLYTEKLGQRALAAATVAFAANFSVWTLYAVLGLRIQEQLDLSILQFGLLLAAPMFSGALLRFPAGMLSEVMSCRKLFIWQMALLPPALFILPWISSYRGYLLAGLWLGVSGVSFTIGIRYVTAWFESRSQGFAMGVFGAGNAGAAVTLALAPVIERVWSAEFIGPAYGLGMLVTLVLFWALAPEDTRYMQARRRADLAYHLQPLKDPQVWRFSLYYYFVFGSFLALLMWLPHYYVNAYGLSLQNAMLLTLLFVTTSSMVRALGGWFADRYGGRAVNWSVFWICLVCLFFLSYPPTSMTIHGVDWDVQLEIRVNVWVFTLLMLVIGVAQGFGRASVYKIIHDYFPDHMGSVGGTVATLGAAGGFTLPIAFALAVEALGVHSASFMVLYGVLAACMVAMYAAIRNERSRRRLREAREHNFLLDD